MDTNLTFVPDNATIRVLCLNISIVADQLVENTERFHVLIDSTDLSVIFSEGRVVMVDITDDSCELSIS